MIVPNRHQISTSKYRQGYDINFNSYQPRSVIVTISIDSSITTCEFHDWLTLSSIYISSFLIVPLRAIQAESPITDMPDNLYVTLK